MSLLALAGQNTAQSTTRRIVIGHFDAHGVVTSAVLCRRIQCSNIIARFPDTGPQRFAAFAKTIDVYGAEIHIVDIPINVATPKEHIDAIALLAQQALSVTLWDHHESNLRYINELPPSVNVRFFSSATEMALAILGGDTGSDNATLAFVGVVADRDPTILKVVDRETVERKLLPLANALDVLVRRDAQQTANNLVGGGLTWLATQATSIDYQPYRLVSNLQVQRRGASTVLVAPTTVDFARSVGLEAWLPKTLEQLLLREGRDYAVIATEQEDRRTGERFWAVRVLKYWLSERPAPTELLKGLPALQGRQIVGHADYISIRAIDRQDAERLAVIVFEQLEAPISQAAHLINEPVVAQAIQADYSKILQLLERIAKALEQGAQAKEKQVELLQQLYERDERTRYD